MIKLVEKPKPQPPSQPQPPINLPIPNGKDDEVNGSAGSNADDDESWQVSPLLGVRVRVSIIYNQFGK